MSVLNQSNLNDTEIILVDDCGTDNSMDVAKRIVDEYPQCNIKIVSHTHNQGLSVARNTGIKHATGDYLFFLDSDDELPENTIANFLKYLNTTKNIDFYIGNYFIEGNFQGAQIDIGQTVLECNRDILEAYLKGNWYSMACGKFINRNFIIKNELWFPKRRLHEDEYFSFLLALKSNRMVVIHENVYIYKIRDNSITTKKKRKNYTDYFWIVLQQIQMLQNSNINNNSVGCHYLINLFYSYFLSISSSNLSLKEKTILLNWTTFEYRKLRCKTYNYKQFIKSSILWIPTNILYIYIYIRTLINCLSFNRSC